MKNYRRNKITIAIGVLFCVFLLLIFIVPSVINKTPQIQSRLLITAIGLEKKDDLIELSCVAIMPINGAEGTQVKSVTITNKAPSIGENLKQISEIYGKQAELGLCTLVVMGSGWDNESIIAPLKYLLSSGSVSPGTYLIHTNSGATKILDLASKLNPSTSSILSSIVQFNAPSTNISTVTLLEFLSETASPSKASIMPEIQIEEGEEGMSVSASDSSQDKSGELGQNSQSKSQNERTTIKDLNKTLLYKEGKIRAQFNANETTAFNLIDSDSSQGVITLDNLVIKGENLGKIICSVYNKSSKRKVYFNNGEPIAQFSVKVILQFLDQHKIIEKWQDYDGKIDVTTPLLSQFEQDVKAKIEQALQKCKENDVDVFQIENDFYRFCSREYKQYKSTHPDFLSNVKTRVNVTVTFK